jgi:hypothetical protein
LKSLALQPISNVFSQVLEGADNFRRIKQKTVHPNTEEKGRENISNNIQPVEKRTLKRFSPFKAIQEESKQSEVPKLVLPSQNGQSTGNDQSKGVKCPLSIQLPAPDSSFSSLMTPTPFSYRPPIANPNGNNTETELPDSLWCLQFEKVTNEILSKQSVEDIDAKMDKGVYCNAYYLNSIHDYQKSLEKDLSPPANYLSGHKYLQKNNRSDLIDIMVSTKFFFCCSVAFF